MSNLIPYQEMSQMAQAIAQSGLFGFKRPEEALALMLVAQAEGRHPALVARDYHIISGKPALKADAMLARFQEAGGVVKWITLSDTEVKAEFTHPNCGSFELSWTMAQAQSAGLTNNPTWKKFPRAMLRSRVISEGIRTALPAVLSGTYSTDEVMQDFPQEKTTLQAEVVHPAQISAEPTKPKATEADFAKLVSLAEAGQFDRLKKGIAYYDLSEDQATYLDSFLGELDNA